MGSGLHAPIVVLLAAVDIGGQALGRRQRLDGLLRRQVVQDLRSRTPSLRQLHIERPALRT